MIFALFGALAIGLSLGLLGSGGSILTVPVLIYLVGQDEKVAIAGSLFIVGLIALVGAIRPALKKQVSWNTVLWFGLPGMAGTWIGAYLSGFMSGLIQLLLFACIMLLAAWNMLKGNKNADEPSGPRQPHKIILDGLIVGTVTGLVGVGGGFLIVPALVILGGLTMHTAVATSLVIIALKSFSGFVKYLDVLAQANLSLDWQILWIIAGIGIIGSLIGNQLSDKLPQQMLKKVFGIFLIIMGLFILIKTAPGLM